MSPLCFYFTKNYPQAQAIAKICQQGSAYGEGLTLTNTTKCVSIIKMRLRPNDLYRKPELAFGQLDNDSAQYLAKIALHELLGLHVKPKASKSNYNRRIALTSLTTTTPKHITAPNGGKKFCDATSTATSSTAAGRSRQGNSPARTVVNTL